MKKVKIINKNSKLELWFERLCTNFSFVENGLWMNEEDAKSLIDEYGNQNIDTNNMQIELICVE
jgi:hypothetical protein